MYSCSIQTTTDTLKTLASSCCQVTHGTFIEPGTCSGMRVQEWNDCIGAAETAWTPEMISAGTGSICIDKNGTPLDSSMINSANANHAARRISFNQGGLAGALVLALLVTGVAH